MELTRERLIIIVSGAVTIAAFVIYFLLYVPLIRELKALYLESRMYENDEFNARNIMRAVKTKEIKGVLITEEDIPFAIAELTRLGRLAGIDFISMTPKKREISEDARYKIFPIEIQIESSYAKLGVFLGSLSELGKSLVTIRSFDVIILKEDPSKLKTELVVNMYLIDGNLH